MASSTAPFTKEAKTTTPAYAPTDYGFAHTSKDQFTYFYGSGSGVYTEFGMPPLELAKLVTQFNTQFQEEKPTSEVAKQLAKRLQALSQQITALSTDQNTYSTNAAMADRVIEYGHIPIILSTAMIAEKLGYSARRVESAHLAEYFVKIPGAKAQCYSYLIKQDMMKAINDFRNALCTERYELDQTDPDFYVYNKLINGIETALLAPNRKSLPRQSVCFDLFPTFYGKIKGIVDGFQHKDNKAFQKECQDLLKDCQGKLYDAQKKLSYQLYCALAQHFQKQFNVTDPRKSSKYSFAIDDAQEDPLQEILPLLHYLNSPLNPFARFGLFNDEVTSDFHQQALKAYAEHESKEELYDSFTQKTTKRDVVYVTFGVDIQSIAPQQVKTMFESDQIAHLLFGPSKRRREKAGQGDGFFARLSSTLTNLLTEGSAGALPSATEMTAQLRALPVPSQYLLLTAPKTAFTPGGPSS